MSNLKKAAGYIEKAKKLIAVMTEEKIKKDQSLSKEEIVLMGSIELALIDLKVNLKTIFGYF